MTSGDVQGETPSTLLGAVSGPALNGLAARPLLHASANANKDFFTPSGNRTAWKRAASNA
jgi:hypothetical protein